MILIEKAHFEKVEEGLKNVYERFVFQLLKEEYYKGEEVSYVGTFLQFEENGRQMIDRLIDMGVLDIEYVREREE